MKDQFYRRKIVIAVRQTSLVVIGVVSSYGITIKLSQLRLREFYLLGFYADYEVYDDVANIRLTQYRHDLYGAVEISPKVGGADHMGDLGFFTKSSTLTLDDSRLKLQHNKVYDFYDVPVLINLNEELFLEPQLFVNNYIPVGNVKWMANYYLDVGYTLY